MKWRGARQSDNVEERSNTTSNNTNGLGGLLSVLLSGLDGRSIGRKASGIGGIGTLVIIALLLFTGNGSNLGSLSNIITGTPQPASYQTKNIESSDYQDEKEFASVVFAYLEDYWQDYFKQQNKSYTNPKLVLYSSAVQTACGQGQTQMGPFYCPADQDVYLDLSFAKELSTTYGAKGDFAMAYVIAHEVGHHVQNELGISDQMAKIRQQVSETEYNQYSVRLELQADYLAGTFAKYLDGEKLNGQPILDVGDIDEAVTAANAVGDDTLQKKYQGQVVPDSFTHGSSKQRIAWFKRGYQYGDLEHGDTFDEKDLNLTD